MYVCMYEYFWSIFKLSQRALYICMNACMLPKLKYFTLALLSGWDLKLFERPLYVCIMPKPKIFRNSSSFWSWLNNFWTTPLCMCVCCRNQNIQLGLFFLIGFKTLWTNPLCMYVCGWNQIFLPIALLSDIKLSEQKLYVCEYVVETKIFRCGSSFRSRLKTFQTNPYICPYAAKIRIFS